MKYYFAYGSNIDEEQMAERLKDSFYKIVGKGILRDYTHKFNKKSIDGTGKANIEKKKNCEVEGVIYEMNEKSLKLLDEYEKGYEKKPLKIKIAKGELTAEVYVAKQYMVDNSLKPKKTYRNKILAGRKWLSKEHITLLESFETVD